MNADSNNAKIQNLSQLKDSKRSQSRLSNLNIFSQDFLYFKNEVLRELKEINNKFQNQKKLNTTIKDLITSQDIKLIEFNNKLEIILNQLNDKKALAGYDNDKVNELINFKSKIEVDLTSYDCKMKLNSEELKNAINRYDKIISDNLILPGIIGSNTKFKDMRDLFYFILNELKVFSAYKDKNSVDLKEYKTKLDSLVSSLNLQISGIIGNANSFTTSNLKIVEKRYLEEIKAFDEKIMKIRLNTLEVAQNFEKDKNKLIDEFKSLKNMKQDLIELINSSIKKVNNLMKKNSDNYEIELFEIKNSINGIKEKMKKEIKNTRNNLKINNEKINYYNLPSSNFENNEKTRNNEKTEINEKKRNNEKTENNEKIRNYKKSENNEKNGNNEKIGYKEKSGDNEKNGNIEKNGDKEKNGYNGKIINKASKRMHSAKTMLQNYIEGNSIYRQLIEQNSLRCKKHDLQSTNLIMKKYYDEDLNIIKNKTINRTIENTINKANSPINENNKVNNSSNTTHKANFNFNKLSNATQKQEKSGRWKSYSPLYLKEKINLEDNNMNDIDNKNTIHFINKNNKNSSRKKILLMKEKNSENNCGNKHDRKNRKINLRENKKRLIEQDKLKDILNNKSKIINSKKSSQLNSLRILYEDIINEKCRELDGKENNNEDEIFQKNIDENKKINNKTNNSFLKEYNAFSSFRFRNNNVNNNKMRQKLNSSEFIKRNNFNENDKDNFISINKYNEYMSARNNKVDESVRNSVLIKNPIYKLKN